MDIRKGKKQHLKSTNNDVFLDINPKEINNRKAVPRLAWRFERGWYGVFCIGGYEGRNHSWATAAPISRRSRVGISISIAVPIPSPLSLRLMAIVFRDINRIRHGHVQTISLCRNGLPVERIGRKWMMRGWP